MIYPSNQTTPKSGNYLWNWLGSPLKKFAAALSPYMGGGDVGYKTYVALLTQTGTDAPVATVLENTLGSDIIWNYELTGVYYGDNINFADPSKVFISFTANQTSIGNGNIGSVCADIYDDGPGNQLWFATRPPNTAAPSDNWGTYISVEIRVYP